MPESCITCKSFVNLSTIQQNEWNILTYLFHPFHRKILPVIRKDQSVQICDKCQGSILCIDKFRIFALENFSGWLVKRSPQTSSITPKRQVSVDPQKMNNISMKGAQFNIGDSEENTTSNKRMVEMELADNLVSLSNNNNTVDDEQNDASSRVIKKEPVDGVPETESIFNEEMPQILANINDQMPQMAVLNTREVGRIETEKNTNDEIQCLHMGCKPAKKRRKRMPKIVSSYQVKYQSQVTMITPKVPIPRIMPKIQVPHIVSHISSSGATALGGPCLTVVPTSSNLFATESGRTVPITAVLLQKPNTMSSETIEGQPDLKTVTQYIRLVPAITKNQTVLLNSSAERKPGQPPQERESKSVERRPRTGVGGGENVHESVKTKKSGGETKDFRTEPRTSSA